MVGEMCTCASITFHAHTFYLCAHTTPLRGPMSSPGDPACSRGVTGRSPRIEFVPEWSTGKPFSLAEPVSFGCVSGVTKQSEDGRVVCCPRGCGQCGNPKLILAGRSDASSSGSSTGRGGPGRGMDDDKGSGPVPGGPANPRLGGAGRAGGGGGGGSGARGGGGRRGVGRRRLGAGPGEDLRAGESSEQRDGAGGGAGVGVGHDDLGGVAASGAAASGAADVAVRLAFHERLEGWAAHVAAAAADAEAAAVVASDVWPTSMLLQRERDRSGGGGGGGGGGDDHWGDGDGGGNASSAAAWWTPDDGAAFGSSGGDDGGAGGGGTDDNDGEPTGPRSTRSRRSLLEEDVGGGPKYLECNDEKIAARSKVCREMDATACVLPQLSWQAILRGDQVPKNQPTPKQHARRKRHAACLSLFLFFFLEVLFMEREKERELLMLPGCVRSLFARARVAPCRAPPGEPWRGVGGREPRELQVEEHGRDHVESQAGGQGP